ncbi:MAG: hypothetical protein KAS76_00725 [Thermoplasmatales archaeon]|nr:hypothetical protein [Thermoplasmatales archaeon]MCK4995805.1 hypothetical protein [Thermoplasmatales archaeon]MCK5636348.1 hypothetical protein [Thermoplasmatales archaeon]
MPNRKVSMNKELQEWINESKEEMKTVRAKKRKSKKPSGKCQICGEKTATTVCLKCGKSVCKACHFKIIGVCKKCIPPEIAGKWDGSKTDWEKELGVDWVG